MPRRNLYLLVLIAAVSIVCYKKADSANRSRYGQMFETFATVMQEIEENFVEEVDPRKVFEAGLAGMADSLGDRYSRYFPPRRYDDLREDLDQRFGGIGIHVRWDKETKTLLVTSPLVGTPAYKAGVRSGDRIVKIDGRDTTGMTLEDAVDSIKGRPGESVRLSVLHAGEETPEEFNIERAEIKVPTVLGDRYNKDATWNYTLEQDPSIAYVRLIKFGEDTVDELQRVLTELEKQGIKGLILDLRDNPGGLLKAAVQVCDLFIDSGTIVSTRDREGRKQGRDRELFHAHSSGTFTRFPIVVLVNHHSASASEIVAACLQDHKRAKVVGERSFGKGSVQNVITLEDGNSALKLTIAHYWRPSGRNIHRRDGAKEEDDWGVRPEPGGEVKMDDKARKELFQHRRDRDILPNGDATPPPLNLDLDPQLKKAIEMVKEEPSQDRQLAA